MSRIVEIMGEDGEIVGVVRAESIIAGGIRPARREKFEVFLHMKDAPVITSHDMELEEARCSLRKILTAMREGYSA